MLTFFPCLLPISVSEKIRNRLGLESGYTLVPKTREHLLKYEPSLADLPARSMQDSFTSSILPPAFLVFSISIFTIFYQDFQVVQHFYLLYSTKNSSQTASYHN